jgi:hypothetical protein
MRPKLVSIIENSPDSDVSIVPSVGFVGGLSYFDAITIVATIQGATGGTLDIYLQTSYDVTPELPADSLARVWYDYAHYQQLADGASPLNIVWHVDRSTPVTAETSVGTGLNPALGVSTVNGGAWGDLMRVLFVPGAGTTAGTEQIVTFVCQCVKP